MARIITKIGDVFSADMGDGTKRYPQYVANDLTQLNSDVVRVFKRVYPLDGLPDLQTIIKDEVDFYAHCVVKWGVQLGYWKKIGKSSDIGKVQIYFRSSGDDGNLEVKISNNWWVWKINEEEKWIGKLVGEFREAEIGSVIPPDSIVYRMKAGKYDFVYPAFE